MSHFEGVKDEKTKVINKTAWRYHEGKRLFCQRKVDELYNELYNAYRDYYKDYFLIIHNATGWDLHDIEALHDDGFCEAVEGYEPKRGNFANLLATIIRRNKIAYGRKECRKPEEITLDEIHEEINKVEGVEDEVIRNLCKGGVKGKINQNGIKPKIKKKLENVIKMVEEGYGWEESLIKSNIDRRTAKKYFKKILKEEVV